MPTKNNQQYFCFSKTPRVLLNIIFAIVLFCRCSESSLHIVTVTEFQEFVEATGYVTIAEQYDWSIVQRDVINYDVLYGVNWRCPTGEMVAKNDEPVTQVCYLDANAYAEWAGLKLPTYTKYWEVVSNDTRNINSGTSQILPIDQVNIVGNVWEITTPDAYRRIRLAGGSYLCNETTCNGTSSSRLLYVDQETGNSHIGFAVYE